MNYTTTLTSKSQITIPKAVRDKLGLKLGTKIDIFSSLDGTFVGRPKRESNIMRFAGMLADVDDGRSLGEIRDEAGRIMAEELTQKYEASSKYYVIKIKKHNK